MCKNCLQLLEKLFNFHQSCIKSENRISTYLKDMSEDFKKHFKLFDLFTNHEEKEDPAQNDKHEDVDNDVSENDDETNEDESNEDNLNNLEISSISMEGVQESTDKEENPVNKSSEDVLLEQLDTAVLSCEDNLSQSDTKRNSKRKMLPVDLNDFIEEIYLSDEKNNSPEKAKKHYNTRNKKKKIVVETDDNVSKDPDFNIDHTDDDSDEDYVEGTETFGFMPKSR